MSVLAARIADVIADRLTGVRRLPMRGTTVSVADGRVRLTVMTDDGDVTFVEEDAKEGAA